MVLWHWCWGNWKDWILIFIVLTGLHLWTLWVQIKQCCQELQQLLSKESSLLLIDSNVAWEVTQCHPKDFHVSALFVMDRKRQSLGKVYSVHMNSGEKKQNRKIQLYYPTREQRDQSHPCSVWAVPLIHTLTCSWNAAWSHVINVERRHRVIYLHVLQHFLQKGKSTLLYTCPGLSTTQLFTPAVELCEFSIMEGLKGGSVFYSVLEGLWCSWIWNFAFSTNVSGNLFSDWCWNSYPLFLPQNRVCVFLLYNRFVWTLENRAQTFSCINSMTDMIIVFKLWVLMWWFDVLSQSNVY